MEIIASHGCCVAGCVVAAELSLQECRGLFPHTLNALVFAMQVPFDCSKIQQLLEQGVLRNRGLLLLVVPKVEPFGVHNEDT